MYRRRFLVGAALVAGTAGCLSDSVQATDLGRVAIVNRAHRAYTVHLRVRWDGEIVHDRRYELAADDPDDGTVPGVVPPRTWPEEAGRFTVAARKPDDEWHTLDPATLDYPRCLGVSVSIDPQGDLAIYHSSNPNECAG